MRALRAALLALLAACPTAAATAASQGELPGIRLAGGMRVSSVSQTVLTCEVSGVEVTGTYAWPQTLTRGWFPVQVAMVNRSAERRVVQLEALGGSAGDVRVRAQIELAPGASGTLELLCAAGPWGSSGYHLHVRTGGELGVLPALGPLNHPRHVHSHMVPIQAHLVLPAPGTESVTVERWRAALTKAAPQQHVLGALSGPAELARRPESYSSLSSVSLDSAAGAPDGEQLAALSTWARGGGRLVLYGQEAEALARARPAFGAWMQERFRLHGASGMQVWRMGHGRLLVCGPDSPFDDEKQLERLLEDDVAEQRAPGLDLAELPLRSLTVLLVLFAILIGPVNFILVKRSGRPTLLLLTVPAIALVASVLLVLYAALAQGLSVRSASSTLTVLDQRHALATTREARVIFAGSSPGPGLRPGAGTTVMPPDHGHNRAAFELRHLVDLRGGTLLGGDWLRVRVEQKQSLISERPSRARLDVRIEDGVVIATNALGAAVGSLLVHLEDGSLHQTEQLLAPGAQGALSRLPSFEPPPSVPRVAHLWTGRSIPPGTWFARLERSPFSDDLGLALEERAGDHAVLGVLPGPEDER